MVRRALVKRGVQSSVESVRGFPVHYYDAPGTGRGSPVLLVHGLGGSANGFYKVILPLRRRFSRVVAPDLPGHGFSPLPAVPLGLRAQLDVLSSFCDQVVRDRAFAVGNSLGGALCIEMADGRPDLVRALGLIAPAGAQLPEARLAEVFAAMKVRSSADARALTRRLFHRAPWVALLFAAELRQLYDTPAVRAIMADIDHTVFLTPGVLSGLSVPTLLLWGGSEKLLPPEAIDYFRAHLPPQATVRVVEGFGHVPHIERPGEVVKYLVDFADRARL